MSGTTSPKKRKQSAQVDDGSEPATKRSRKEGKGKTEDRITSYDTGEFRVVTATLVVSIPPVFASNPKAGVQEMLDSMIMRYIPALRGVVLAHSNFRFMQSSATIKADCPFGVSTVAFDSTVWSPQVGMKLIGMVNLCSPDHISLLVHRTFNVSIPRHHIPTDHWEFEYGPAENDPEYGPAASNYDGDAYEVDELHPTPDVGGKWIHKITADKLGGITGTLEFTVVGLTIANQMLSLIGSIQPDPFSSEHVAQPAVLGDHTRRRSAPIPITVVNGDGHDVAMDDELESDEDPFSRLGRMGDEAAREAEKRATAAEADAEEVKAKKRKRKEEKRLERLALNATGDDIADGTTKKKKEKKKLNS